MGVVQISSLAAFRDALGRAGRRLVLVDFTASWCGPCRMIAPEYEKLSREYASTVDFLKVDVDDARDVAQSCGITAMPTFHGYRNGSKLFEIRGADPRKLRSTIEAHASKVDAFSGTGQRLGSGDGGPPKVDWSKYSNSNAGDVSSSSSDAKKSEPGSTKAYGEKASGEKASGEKASGEKASGEKASGEKPTESEQRTSDPRLKIDENMLKQLEEMGFPRVRAEKGLILTGNKSTEAAMEWIFAHTDDADIDEPLQVVTSDGAPKPQLSAKERKQIAEELVAKARTKRAEEERKAEYERERNRIRTGKEASLARAKLEEEERKRSIALRRKEKAEAKAERARILAQLEADKAARMAKFKKNASDAEELVTAPTPPTENIPLPAVTAGKIQLRLPDGKRIEKTFEPSETVGDVVAFVKNQRPDIAERGFELVQQYPRRKFTYDDYNLTLEAVQLLPRGALVVSYQ